MAIPKPTPTISHITWVKVMLTTTILYTIHWSSTFFYSNYCATGWMGAALITAPHCSMSFNIMDWSRQWYLATCWIMVAKIVQDVSYFVEWIIYKGDSGISQLYNNQIEDQQISSQFHPGTLYKNIQQNTKILHKKTKNKQQPQKQDVKQSPTTIHDEAPRVSGHGPGSDG